MDEVDPVKLGAKEYAKALAHFQLHWARGDPVVVRGVEAGCCQLNIVLKAPDFSA